MLPKNYAILTAESPKFPTDAPGKTYTNEDLTSLLSKHGYKAFPVQGTYGGTQENSFIVPNLTLEHAQMLGKKFGQESVVHAQNSIPRLVYTNGPDSGKAHPHVSQNIHQQKPEDNYTHIPGMGYLQIDFDWNKKVPVR